MGRFNTRMRLTNRATQYIGRLFDRFNYTKKKLFESKLILYKILVRFCSGTRTHSTTQHTHVQFFIFFYIYIFNGFRTLAVWWTYIYHWSEAAAKRRRSGGEAAAKHLYIYILIWWWHAHHAQVIYYIYMYITS